MQQPVYNEVWGQPFVATDCPNCSWIFLTTQERANSLCPHCGQEKLEPLSSEDDLPYTQAPELLIRPTLDKNRLEKILADFSTGIPYASDDLTAAKLMSRMRRVYLPMWMVDVDVSANWQAEVGYNYEVVSHRERLQGQSWRSEEVKEARIRWEPRVGELRRHYANAAAPALEDFSSISARIGEFGRTSAINYRPADVADAYIRLPNRPPEDAWSDAAPVIRGSAAVECHTAAGGQHIRQFRWSPGYDRQEWTQLLLPMYTTYYQDDDRKVQMVMIQGQTGQVFGSRRSSMKRAQNQSIIIALVALLIGVVSLLVAAAGLLVPPLVIVGGIGLFLALIVMFAAGIPIGRAWQFNHNHARKSPLRLDNANMS